MTETKLQERSENQETKKHRVGKEKLRGIMEAASALTALGDESDSGSRPNSPRSAEEGMNDNETTDEHTEKNEDGGDAPKRFLPDHKKPDAAPTFPEKLMSLMRYTEKQGDNFCVTWCEDGKSFVIRNPDDFTRHVVPKFFKATKFSSFTRKLYRWGFRQINRGIGPDDPIIFGNDYFQKDHEELIAKMRSVTAASARKAEQSRMVVMSNVKRTYDDPYEEDPQKRMLFDHFLQQQKQMNMMAQGQSFYGGMNSNGSIPLSNALRPSLGLGSGPGMTSMGNSNMMMNQSGGQNSSMMMNPMSCMNQMNQIAPPMNHLNPYNMQSNQMSSPQFPANTPQYPNAQSTAEIVNAAIAALRHAN